MTERKCATPITPSPRRSSASRDNRVGRPRADIDRQAGFRTELLCTDTDSTADLCQTANVICPSAQVSSFDATLSILPRGRMHAMTLRPFVTLVVALAFLALAGQTHARCTSQQIGTTIFHTCSDGRSWTSQTIGTTTYHNSGSQSGTSQQFGNSVFHNFGTQSGTSQRFGNTTFHNFGTQSGTSQRFGNTTFHNFGTQSGTSQRFGNTTFHNFAGQSGTSQRIGGMTFHNR